MTPGILAIDIGGTGIKASVLDNEGSMLTEGVRVDTPVGAEPMAYVKLIADIAGGLPAFDRIAVGCPGVGRDGAVRTAPTLGNEGWQGFPLTDALADALGKPCRLGNDADVQGFAVIKGNGIEMVVTLGTGFGSAVYQDGRLTLHLELAHHEFREGQTYNEQIGEAARAGIGNVAWRRRVHQMIANMRTLVMFDRLYIGGGNARHLEDGLPDDVECVDNRAGILGGAWLWKD
ncbi:MAG: ROK family protein [Planctomycetota bacterium]|nr:ROK family protein [Planctomycetota bacterium]